MVDRVAIIEEAVRAFEGIDDDTDLADLIAYELRLNPERDNDTIAHTVAQRVVQA